MTNVALERLCYTTYTKLANELIDDYWNQIEFNASEHHDFHADTTLFRLNMRAFGRLVKEKYIRYPATWWDAFKLEVFPYWLRKRLKISYTTKTLTAREVYPDISIKDRKSVIYYNIEHGVVSSE